MRGSEENNYIWRTTEENFLPPPGLQYLLALFLLSSWFQEPASHPSPAGAPAHVLLREESVLVEPDGRQTITTRGVLRILTPDGVRYARAAVSLRPGRQLIEFRAWVQPPAAAPRELGPSAFTDQPSSFPASRLRQVAAAVPPGGLFFYQSTIVATGALPQHEFEFQDTELPVRLSRFRIKAPASWDLRPVLFAAPAVRTANTWELRELPAHPPAPPRLALTLLPNHSNLPRFATWADVAAWLAARVDPAAQTTPPLAAQAQQLTAHLPQPRQRIAALAAFVQRLRSLPNPDDFVPASAAQTIARGAGDSLDKATLLRALLRAIGIPSSIVALNAAGRVRPEWPSPRVFNSAAVAIPLDSGLLYCDPSAPHRSLDGLPALLLREGANLETVPGSPGEIDRKIILRLEDNGRTTGRLLETARGAAANVRRALLASGTYDATLAEQLQARIVELKTQDDPLQNVVHVYVEYGQDNRLTPAGRLWSWNPLAAWEEFAGSISVHENVEIELPAGWAVEQMPEPVQSNGFAAAWYLQDRQLVIDRFRRPSSGGAIAVERLPLFLKKLP